MTRSSSAHEAIGRLLPTRAGLAFQPARVAEAEDGIRRAMSRMDATDIASYAQELDCGAADFDDLVSEIVVSETYFFREPGQFDFMRTRILPSLVSASFGDPVVRLWSAGCASGEEASQLEILDQGGAP